MEGIEMVDVKYVNAYRVSRHYGGPEEGGWWYDSGEPLASVPLELDSTQETIQTVRDRLTALLGWTDSRNRYSVLGGDDFEIYVQSEPAAHFPDGRPHYE
jgi:hypothetical protein